MKPETKQQIESAFADEESQVQSRLFTNYSATNDLFKTLADEFNPNKNK